MEDAKLQAYKEWQALQRAPLPYWRTKPFVPGDTLEFEDIAWMADYERWYFGTRLHAMRGLDPSPFQQIVELERENAELREAIKTATLEALTRAAPMEQESLEQ